jgi:zinc protease
MQTFSLKFFFVAVVLLLVGFYTEPTRAQTSFLLSDPIPIGPQVKIGKLPNGLTYYIHKNAKPEKRVEMRLVIKAGSILEDDDQQGLAHFIEHMAFNGSKRFKKHELVSYLQSLGVKFGADLNAYTGFDETVYILPIPTENRANLDVGFQILSDWAQGLTLDSFDIDKERAVILEEARIGKGLNDRINSRLLPEVFNGSRYAQRLPIGKEDVIKNAPAAVIRRFYTDWYRPNLMAVILVGDIEVVEAEKLIDRYFRDLKNPKKERPRNYTKVPPRLGSTALVIADKEATDNSVLVRYPVTSTKPQKIIKDYRDAILRRLVINMLAQRVQELAQQANPPFRTAFSSVIPIAPGYEAFNILAVLGRGGIVPALSAVIQENERARQYGFTEEELERVKKNYLRGIDSAFLEKDKISSTIFAAEYARNFLVQESLPGLANESLYAKEFVPSITLGEINALARLLIPHGKDKLVAYVGSNKEDQPVPTKEELLDAVEKAHQAIVEQKQETALRKTLLPELPKAGSIVSEKVDAELQTTTLELSNGIKVVLKPSDFQNDQIVLSAARFGGQSLYEQSDYMNANYAAAVKYSMGVYDLSPSEFQRVIAGKSFNFSFSIGPYLDSISGSSSNADLEDMLQGVYLGFQKPRVDRDLFQAFLRNSQDSARNALASPEAIFNDRVFRQIYNNHPRLWSARTPEDFSRLEMERALAIYQERFGSAYGLRFTLVGSFDVEKIKPLLARYLASLPTPQLVTDYKDLGINPLLGQLKQEVFSGSAEKSQVSLIFSGPATYTVAESNRLAVMVDILNLKVTDVLREKLGLIYGGGFNGNLTRFPTQSFLIEARVPCAPENVEKVVNALISEIDKLQTLGPDPADLAKVQENWKKDHQIRMRTNDYWASLLQDKALLGDDPRRAFDFNDRIRAITTEEIKAVAKKYLDRKNFARSVLYPEKK